MSGGQLRAAEVRALLRVESDRQSERARVIEHLPDLRRRERDVFAEPVDRVHQSFAVRLFQTGPDNLREIIRVPAGIFRRDRVRRQIAGADAHGTPHFEPARDPQHFQFGLDVQAVARPDLDGADAFGQQRVEPGQRLGEELGFGARVGVADGREDAAAGAGDLLVRRARQPLFELTRAVAAENEVRVAIDERWRDQPPLAVGHLRAGIDRRQIVRAPGEHDASVFDQDRAVFHDPETRFSLAEGRQSRVSPTSAGGRLVVYHGLY